MLGVIYSSSSSSVKVEATTSFTGAATGKRYTVTDNSTIRTSGSGENFLPGNAAGTANTATGGYYI
jgi:hypothetical protein